MKVITIFTVSPAGVSGEDCSRMEEFAAGLNQVYEKFNLRVEMKDYGRALDKTEGGQYSVKELRSELTEIARRCVLCCVVFFCKKEEVSPGEMSDLLRGLMQLKRAEIVAYFKPQEDMQPVRNDIMRRVSAIDEKNIIPREDRKHFSDMAKNFLNYGCACDRENKIETAEAAYKESLMIQRKLTKADENTYLQDLSLPYHNLGTLYYRTGRLKEAEPMYLEALRTRKLLAEKKGDSYLALAATSGTNLGALYVQTGRFEEAEKMYLEVLKIRKGLAEEDREGKLHLADIFGNLGSLYNRMENMEKAEENFSEAMKLQREFLKNNSSDEKTEELLKKKIAMAANTLGVLYMKQKRYEDAEAGYTEAFELYTELAQKNADEYEPSLGMVNYNLAHIYRGMNQSQKAVSHMQKAYEICQARRNSSKMCGQLYEAMNEEQKAAVSQRIEFAENLEKQAEQQRESAQFEDAAKSYIQAAGLYQGLPELKYQGKAALLFTELGLLYWDIAQLNEAEASYKASVGIYRRMARADESHLPDLAIASYNLGRFYQETRNEEVNDQLREAFEIAGRCLDDSEQCREIYENLQDEPLYEEEIAGSAEDIEKDAAEEGTETAEEAT
ncbi:MAG: tetratricopeptide repeat protein, partial [Lachnospiraceae bacterium]|nr:tetratricopeptide repeat protein [Lachnospiraceae bacterium]